MPSYKLHYFDARGAAEGARILFAIAGQDFEDVRHGGEEWQTFKPSTPNGQLPVLEIDGTMYPQSGAIVQYIAEEFNLNGKSSIDRLIINGLIGDKDDMIKKYPFRENDEAEKKKKIECFMNESAPDFFGKIEKSVTKRGASNFFVSEQISVADVIIQQIVEFLASRQGSGPDEMLKNFPKTKAIYDNVINHPKVKAWIEKRPKTEY